MMMLTGMPWRDLPNDILPPGKTVSGYGANCPRHALSGACCPHKKSSGWKLFLYPELLSFCRGYEISGWSPTHERILDQLTIMIDTSFAE